MVGEVGEVGEGFEVDSPSCEYCDASERTAERELG